MQYNGVMMATRQRTIQTLKVVTVVAIITLAAYLLVCGLVLLQGQQDESRRVDALMVFCPSPPPKELLQHALERYRQGYAPRVLLVGEGAAEAQATLRAWSLPESTLLVLESRGSKTADVRQVGTFAYQQRLRTLLVVDTPDAMLLDLKMLRDQGVLAYASPAVSNAFGPRAILGASRDYWGYILFQGTAASAPE